MNTPGWLPEFLCALIVLIPLVVIGIYGTKAKFRYVSFTNKLRRNGEYTEWANKNRLLLLLENFFLYAFLASFVGFIIVGVLNLENIAIFLFVCFIVSCFLAVVVSFALYRKVPKE